MMENKQILTSEKIKMDFPIFNNLINGRRLVYLDNGATTLVPRHVVDAMGWYYNNCKSSVHRGDYFYWRDYGIFEFTCSFSYEGPRRR